MTVSTINKFFGKIGRVQVKYRWAILGVFFVLTAVLCAGLSNFAFSLGDEGWYGAGDEIKVNQKKYEETFGNINGLGVLLVRTDGGDVFSEDMLTVIDTLGNRMRDEIPFADRLSSIIEVDIPVGNEEGFEVKRPYPDGVPSDPQQLEAGRALIMRGTEKTNALINSMVSDDGKETWIFLSLLPYEGELLEQQFGGDVDEVPLEIGYKLMEIVESPEFQSDAYHLYPAGIPYDDACEDRYDIPEYFVRVVLGFAVMLVFLALFLRNVFGVVVPALTTVGAIASVLGGMSYFGAKADSTLITLPIILGMALSVGYSVHYINMFKLFFRRTGNRRESVIASVEECGWPVLFTVLTTMTSFVSFMFVNMKPLEWMGKTAALIVLAVYVYIAVLIPILLSFGKNRAPDAAVEKDAGGADEVSGASGTNGANGATALDMKFSRWADVVQKKTGLVIALTAAIIIAFIPGIFKIHVSVDFASISGEKMPYIAELRQMLKAKLGNEYSYSVMVSYDEEGAFKAPEKMSAVGEFEDFLGTLSLTKQSGTKPRVSSVTSVLKEMNCALNEGNAAFYTVPNDEYILAQLLELSNIELHDDFSDYMDDEFRTTVFNVDMTKYSESEALKNVAQIKEKYAELFPEATCCILGDMIQYAEMSQRIVRGGVISVGFSFIIIAVMLILAFSSIRTGLIGMIPNIAPVIVVGGVMGYRGYSLDFGTVTVMPMILGIAVDDTIHLTTHLKMGLEKYGSYKTAMEASFREIGSSMFLTTLILCAMFAVYLFSPMNLLAILGVLIIIGLSGALAADYTITPALLYAVKPFGKEKA